MTISIRLGGKDYPIAPLKFRDLKRVLPLFLQLGMDSEAKVDAQGEILTAAIATADPAFTRAQFDELTPDVEELRVAVSAVARLSGLKPGAPQPGEAPAARPSLGATSTG
ncbi:MAG TPA: hypothetical protein VKZ79_03560 [Alphaproteobacteria bacterium]|nr:hypothetical protein [Alphaproteobacteria bacterium]